jgi:hypothetical protein
VDTIHISLIEAGFSRGILLAPRSILPAGDRKTAAWGCKMYEMRGANGATKAPDVPWDGEVELWSEADVPRQDLVSQTGKGFAEPSTAGKKLNEKQLGDAEGNDLFPS